MPPLTIVDCETNYNSEHQVDERDRKHGRLKPAAALVFWLVLAGCSIAPPPADNAGALREIAARDGGAELVVQGTILRVLPTSAGPSGLHERFIVQISSGTATIPLFVADNISVGSAAPLHQGDHVVVKGELAFNDLGPVLHWTHRDPRMRHQPGFVEVGGRIYE